MSPPARWGFEVPSKILNRPIVPWHFARSMPIIPTFIVGWHQESLRVQLTFRGAGRGLAKKVVIKGNKITK